MKQSHSFAIWRTIFGVYLSFYYFRLIPFARQIYSREGIFTAQVAGHETYLPTSFLKLFDQPFEIDCLIYAALVLSLLFMFGWRRRLVAASLFLIEFWLVNRNSYTPSPESPFVSWLILANVLIPERLDSEFTIPIILRTGAWITLAAGYAYAARTKLLIPESPWLDGTAVYKLLNFDPCRYGWYGDLFLKARPISFPLTGITILLQLCGPLLICFYWGRVIWLLGMTTMHVSILPFLNVTQVALGMLMFHGFILSFSWRSILRGIGFDV